MELLIFRNVNTLKHVNDEINENMHFCMYDGYSIVTVHKDKNV